MEGGATSEVHGLAGILHGAGHRRRTAREHAELLHLRVDTLQGGEERGQVGSAEVCDGAQAGEQRTSADLLEVTLADVEHGGAQVELGVELSDEDVGGDEVAGVVALHVTDDVHHPL